MYTLLFGTRYFEHVREGGAGGGEIDRRRGTNLIGTWWDSGSSQLEGTYVETYYRRK